MLHRSSGDVGLIASGLILSEVLRAADMLAAEGIEAGVIEVHTIKPMLAPEVIEQEARKSGTVVTIEEHNIVGGLGTVVSEILVSGDPVRLKKLGLIDTFAESGTPEELQRKYHLSERVSAKKSARSLIERSLSMSKYSLHKSQAQIMEMPGRTIYLMVGSDKLKSDRMSFGVTEVPPETDMPPHTHESEEEIVFIVEGYGEAIVGGSVEMLEPNTVVVFPVGVEHLTRNTGKNPMKFTFCFNPCRDFSK